MSSTKQAKLHNFEKSCDHKSDFTVHIETQHELVGGGGGGGGCAATAAGITQTVVKGEDPLEEIITYDEICELDKKLNMVPWIEKTKMTWRKKSNLC